MTTIEWERARADRAELRLQMLLDALGDRPSDGCRECRVGARIVCVRHCGGHAIPRDRPLPYLLALPLGPPDRDEDALQALLGAAEDPECRSATFTHSQVTGIAGELLRQRREALRAREAVVAVRGLEQGAWDLRSILVRLADAADHLLEVHSCDVHGHEGIAYARDAARKLLREVLENPDGPLAATVRDGRRDG